MPNPPDLPVSGVESPIDRTLTLSLAGEPEAALRWAAALVKSEPAGPVGLLLVGRLLGALERPNSASDALDVCIARAVDAGNLPVAVAACCAVRAAGRNPAACLDTVASAYAKSSDRLLDKGALPPKLPGRGQEFHALPAALGGPQLIERVEQIVSEAKKLYEIERSDGSHPPKLPHHALFSSLDVAGLRAMIGIFDVRSVTPGSIVIEEGTVGAEAYIVARGELEVQRHAADGGVLRLARLGNGALFGEMALLSRAPRAASVVAARPTILLVATKDALEAVVSDEPEVGREFALHCRQRMVENLIRTSSILRAVKAKERVPLVDSFETLSFETGQKLIEQGQESNGLYLIASGEVAVIHREGDDSTVIATLGVGEVVGEVALVLRRPASADVIAEHPTLTLHLPREGFLAIVKQHPALFAELYELAVKRDEETSSIVAQEATDIEDFVLV